jgi:hypothetical protein
LVVSACRRQTNPNELQLLTVEATQVTEELKKKLQKLGFVPDAGGDGKSLVGMVPINKLKEITALSDVTAVKLEQSPAKT